MCVGVGVSAGVCVGGVYVCVCVFRGWSVGGRVGVCVDAGECGWVGVYVGVGVSVCVYEHECVRAGVLRAVQHAAELVL